ncbi:MtnX-like HAD-IB family phosphatase [Alicyclobacillus tolerans]|uniref:2-hydroxy-3-keto-5-methylthiopentenyl-1-phosphate phosphatase n=1 Tax=Alicyclobacillus tolerans TaxID=90970 RepID=A0A1M6PMA3_9BACL|nr:MULTISPECIES: MtnX-like HAD-IB family phosphatase [Alicyclobacillus]SHK09086.1 2-hydroxy-3-keto-5-methylthiopentenyl-1-phosphatephosphatase [Alicyclobacillus montanus]
MISEISILCDFDGTLSLRDMVATIALEFAPHTSRPLIEAVQAREISVREGVSEMFRNIPASKYSEVVKFSRERTVLRPGAFAMVDYAMQQGWNFSVVSGGFDFFVRPALLPVASFIRIYCNRLREKKGMLEVVWPYGCDESCDGGCGLCKVSLLRQHQKEGRKILLIGDGVTDVKAARLADYVFARSVLAEILREEGVPFTPYETFHDIIRALSDNASEVHQYVSIQSSC